jgi:hypothetical protein
MNSALITAREGGVTGRDPPDARLRRVRARHARCCHRRWEPPMKSTAPTLLMLFVVASAGCAPLDDDPSDPDRSVDALTVPVLGNCSEASIRANAPPDADAMLDRAFTWIHRAVPYCQCVRSSSAPFRADCSGFVSMAWNLRNPPQGHTTYSFAGGPWDSRLSVRLASRAQLRVGDALNYPGDFRAGTGHVVLFGGWRNAAHTRFCSLEESHTGTPARVIERQVDPVYLPIRLASRRVGPLCSERCDGHVLVDGDCDRHDCRANGGRCVDDAHGARCVDPGCPTWGRDTVCLDARTVITCLDGDRRGATACTGANARCRAEGSGVRCESVACPAAGTRDVCLPSGQIARCASGRIGDGRPCPAGTFCSEAGAGDAACVARACVASATVAPVAHDACLPGGARLRCDARGAATTAACPAGQACSTVDGFACVAARCPAASGAVALCAGDERVVCTNGVVTARARCAGRCVADDGTPARCVATACVVGGAVTARSACQDERTVLRCDGEGVAATQACGAGARCAVDASGAAGCVTAAAPADAGSVISDAGSVASDAGAGAGADAGEEAAPEEPAPEDPGTGEEPPADEAPADEPGAPTTGGCDVGGAPAHARGAAALLLAGAALGRRRRRRF